jgi:ATP-binding cassette, subfamily B, bacterial MsbA
MIRSLWENFSFLLKHSILFFTIVLTGIGASLLEGLGITFIFPILETAETTKTFVPPFPFNHITDLFSGLGLVERLRIVAVLLVGVIVMKNILLFVNNISAARLQIASVKHFRMSCFNQLMAVGMGYYNKRNSGEFYSICNGHTHTLGVLINTSVKALFMLFNIFVYLIIITSLSWKMTLVSVFLAGLGSFLIRVLVQNAEIAGKAYANTLTHYNSVLLELLSAMKVIRLFSREKETTDSFDREVDGLNSDMFRIAKLRGGTPAVFEGIGIICLGLILVLGAGFIEGGEFNLSSLAIFLVIFQRISGSAMALNSLRVAILGDLPACRMVFEFLNMTDKEHLEDGKEKFTGLKKSIEFRDVEFSYDSDEEIVLRRISLQVPRGAKVGIVGTSGAGKSTITELLLRFYDAQKGQILIDGVELKDLQISSWRKKIGVVAQDTFLFNDTIKGNIAYAKPGATDEEIEDAARRAHAHGFIANLSRGYDTMIGERGVLLSGGQKQRIAIARAIIIQPDILIFDEATSALDTESEQIVQKALEEIGEGKTVITIAHRLSTIRNADLIAVMERGEIIEFGNHQALLDMDQVYKKLVQTQELA